MVNRNTITKAIRKISKTATVTKPSIYSDEIQSQFLEDDVLALQSQAPNTFSLDRSTPMGTLKQMMREYYSPNTLLDNTTATAMVLSVEPGVPSFLETIEGYSASDKVQLLRIRVLSDPRNYWLPVPKAQDDPVISLYPIVKKPHALETIQIGDIVKVDFYNNKSQFSSITDVGEVMHVVAKSGRPFDTPLIEREVTRLPAQIPALVAIPLPEIDLKDTSAGKKGQALINDESFNKKLSKIAKRLKLKKADLIQIMAFESRADPAAFSKKTIVYYQTDPKTKKKKRKTKRVQFATGLIQIVPTSAAEVGTTIHKLIKMTGTKQLDYVEKYFEKKLKTYKAKDLGDLYLMVFYPYAINQPDTYILGQRNGRNLGLKRSLRKLYPGRTLPRHIAIQNPYFGKAKVAGGVLTRKLVKDWFTKKWNKGKPKYKDPYKDIYK